MKRPVDARVVSIVKYDDFLVALSADGTLWCAQFEPEEDGNGDTWLTVKGSGNHGWVEMEGPFDYDRDGNSWTDTDEDEP